LASADQARSDFDSIRMRPYRINCRHRKRTGVTFANEDDSLFVNLSGTQLVSGYMLYLI
jgi:hypothetical protein